MLTRWFSGIAVGLLLIASSGSVALGQASHVRWDIIHLNPTTVPPTLSAGGEAFATTKNPSSLKIKQIGRAHV